MDDVAGIIGMSLSYRLVHDQHGGLIQLGHTLGRQIHQSPGCRHNDVHRLVQPRGIGSPPNIQLIGQLTIGEAAVGVGDHWRRHGITAHTCD